MYILYVCMYVCMYICIYVCMYVHMYICMFVNYNLKKMILVASSSTSNTHLIAASSSIAIAIAIAIAAAAGGGGGGGALWKCLYGGGDVGPQLVYRWRGAVRKLFGLRIRVNIVQRIHCLKNSRLG